MDTATCSTRADWDVLCAVAHAGYSWRRAHITLSYNSALCPSTRLVLALVSEYVLTKAGGGTVCIVLFLLTHLTWLYC